MTGIRVQAGEVAIWSRLTGPDGGPVLALSHGLGLDSRMWDAVLPLLPPSLRVLVWDHRGHGRSGLAEGRFGIGRMVSDAEAVLDAHGVRDVVLCGLSLGGIVAQGLAVKRLDLVRGAILSNTAARIGTPQSWADRIEAIRAQGMETFVDSILPRWFGRDFRATGDVGLWRGRVLGTPLEGYLAGCAALAGADFFDATQTLRLPALVIAGSEDGSTPPDLVRDLAGLIPGADFALIRRAGHLPPIERPKDWAAVVDAFLRRIGHI